MTIVKILFILSGLLLQLPSSAQNNYEELTGDALQSAPLETAQNLTNTLLTAQKAGEPYILKESEAIAAVQGELSAEKQLQTYSAIRDLFGDYQSVTFEQAFRTTTTPTYYIFRFRGEFERDNAQPEVRVVMNEAEQLAGFSIVPWQENL
ncbi:MAG: hypothetical protein AAGE93_00380 [Bacteroidota bacterium]|mgnify:FL=1